MKVATTAAVTEDDKAGTTAPESVVSDGVVTAKGYEPLVITPTATNKLRKPDVDIVIDSSGDADDWDVTEGKLTTTLIIIAVVVIVALVVVIICVKRAMDKRHANEAKMV